MDEEIWCSTCNDWVVLSYHYSYDGIGEDVMGVCFGGNHGEKEGCDTQLLIRRKE